MRRSPIVMFVLLLALCLCGAICSAATGTGLPADGALAMGQSVRGLFDRGGMLMWPILGCSIVAVGMMLERFWALRAGAVFSQRFFRKVRDLVASGDLDQAIHLSEQDSSPFGRLMTTCLSRADAGGFEMEAALEEAGSRELYDLRQNCRPLGVIADVAPLLGLMGTVIGMIKAFDVVAKAGALGRTELLAEGIGEALITTAFGLGVAIPSILAYHYFRAKTDGLVRIMEDACIEILVLLRKRMKAL